MSPDTCLDVGPVKALETCVALSPVTQARRPESGQLHIPGSFHPRGESAATQTRPVLPSLAQRVGTNSTLEALPQKSQNHSFFPNVTHRGERSGRGSICGLSVSTAQPPGGTCTFWPMHFAGHQVQVQATLRAAAPAKQRLCFFPEAALPLPPCPTGDARALPLGPGVSCGLCLHSHGGCFSSRADPAGLCVGRQGCASSG